MAVRNGFFYRLLHLSLVLWTSGVAAHAFAVESESFRPSTSASFPFSGSRPSPLPFSTLLEASSNQYLNPALNEQPKSYTNLKLDLKYFREESDWEARFDFRSDWNSTPYSSLMLSAPNAYFSHIEDWGTLSVGRKVESFSKLDEIWSMGLWQSRFRRDYLRPETEGLTALWFNKDTTNWGAGLFFSPLFVPEQTPQYRLDDSGHFLSGDRWFLFPPERVRILNSENEIFYTVDKPPVWDLLNHSGFGGELRWGSQSDGPWVKFSAAHKPAPQVALKYRVSQDLSLKSPSYGKTLVTVQPVQRYHDIATTEIGWSWDRLTAFASYTTEKFQRPGEEEDWLPLPGLSNRVWGSGLEWRAGGDRALIRKITLGGLGSSSDKEIINDPIANTIATTEPIRFYFTQAAFVGISGLAFAYQNWSLDWNTRYTEAFDNRGNMLSADLVLNSGGAFSAMLKFDALTSYDESGLDFLSKYRANDRIEIGLRYVF